MKKTDPKTIEIPLYFHNYKLLEDKRFLLKGSAIYFVQGPNRVGKTSFLKALAAIQGAKETTKEPVTRGKEDGYNEFVIPGADGKMYVIKHSFDNKKNKFIAIDEEGNKISSVTDIRKIFNYTHFTVDDFFKLSTTAEGRRKQKEIILQLLTDKEKTEYSELDDLETVKYNERTSINRDKEVQEATLKNSLVTDDESKSLEKLEVTEKEIAKCGLYKAKLHELDKDISSSDARINKLHDIILQIKENLKQHEDELANEEKTLSYNMASLKEIESKLNIQLIIDNKVQVFEFDEMYDQLNSSKTSLQNIAYKKENYDKTTEKLKEINSNWSELNEKIDRIRNRKSEIISKSNLPLDNISFEEGYLTVDGFTFTEDQVCESDGIILIAKIMSEINPGPIQLIGDASVLDFNRLEELNKIAEDKGKVLFVDEVVRDLKDIRVVGYEDIKNGVKQLNTHVVPPTTEKKENSVPNKQSKPIEPTPAPKPEKNISEEKSGNRNSSEIFEKAKEKHRQSLGETIKETTEYINDKEEERSKEKSEEQSEEQSEETDLF